MNLHQTLKTTISIARAAGEILRYGYDQQKEISRKSTAVDWVTQYDTEAEALILQELEQRFPNHRIIAEESGQNQNRSPYTWYIDPLDGTNNFAHGFPVFCVSLALYNDGVPQLGVIYDPLRDECFTAIRGQGAALQRQQMRVALAVSETDNLVDALLATGFPYDRHNSAGDNLRETAVFLKQAQGIRRAGSATLDMAYVAAGRLDGYWEYKLSSWDIAAGALLIQEAGGSVTMIDGTGYAIAPQVSLIASNGHIHPAMLQTLRRANGEP